MKLCADIGGTFIDLALAEPGGALIDRRKIPTPRDDWSALVDDLRAASVKAAGTRPDIVLSIAFAGFIDAETGVATSANVPCADGRSMAQELQDALGRKVVVTNDADCFTLAEAALGSARGHSRVFGIILGTGVGGGLVLDGRLAGGVSGEWGHGPIITQSRSAPLSTPYFLCGCGRWGCLDTVGAARGLERLHLYLHGTGASSLEITRDWQNDERMATQTIDYYLELVSGPLAVILNTSAATIAPVGGGLSTCRQLIDKLDVQVRRGMLQPPRRPIVVPATLGEAAGLLGAAIAADLY